MACLAAVVGFLVTSVLAAVAWKHRSNRNELLIFGMSEPAMSISIAGSTNQVQANRTTYTNKTTRLTQPASTTSTA